MDHTQAAPDDAARRRAGLATGVAGYLFWGGLPLVFTAAAPSSSLEILAHRIVWSLLFCLALLAAARGFSRVRQVFTTPAQFWPLAVASVVIALNWFGFLVGVETNRVVEVSLGYFFNPLVTVLLGVLVLRERLRPLQWAAMGIGLLAVLVIVFGHGEVPWLGLLVSFSFGIYGLLKNRVGGSVGTVEGLTVETAVLTPLALATIFVLIATDASTFGHEGPWHLLLLVALGPITAIPLLLFGASTRRIPLSWVGMLQYITPSIQFVLGVTVLGETMSPARWAGFGIIWVAVAVLTVDMLRAARQPR